MTILEIGYKLTVILVKWWRSKLRISGDQEGRTNFRAFQGIKSTSLSIFKDMNSEGNGKMPGKIPKVFTRAPG